MLNVYILLLVRYFTDLSFDSDSVIGLIMFLYFALYLFHSDTLALSNPDVRGILVISLNNLYGNGVEHPDKTLLLGYFETACTSFY